MVFPFSLPIFVAAGRDMGASAGFYVALTAVYLSMAVIPSAVGIVASLLITSVISARRARLVLAWIGSLALGALVFLVRRLEPEKLMHPDEGVPLIEALRAMQGTDPSWLPSTWALDALWPHLGWSVGSSTHPVALLLAAGAASFFVAGWCFRGLHPRAFSRAQEGLRRESAGRPHGGRGLARLVAARRGGGGPRSFAGLLRWKDRLVFSRDAAQWSQVLILVAIVAIYILNFRYIRVVAGTGLVSDLGLHFLNLGLCAFVAIALAARFVFPSVSLEGAAFWLVLSSPNSMASYLEAKVWEWFPPLAAFANLLLVLTHLSIGADRALLPLGCATVTPLILGLTGLGIGLGGRFPRFGADNAVAVTTGLGGVLFMLASAVLAVLVTVVAIAPTVLVVRMVREARVLDVPMSAVAVACALATVFIPVLAGRWALRIGERHLDGQTL
jgi:ABC-2 type transport system permease protein